MINPRQWFGRCRDAFRVCKASIVGMRRARSANGPRSTRPYQPLVFVFAAMAGGVLLDRYAPVPLPVAWSIVAGLLGSWLVCRWFDRRRLAAGLVLAAVAVTAGSWHHIRWRMFAVDELGRFAGDVPQPVCVEAIALTSPVRRPAPPHDPMCTMPQREQSILRVRACLLRCGGQWRTASGTANLVVDGRLTEVCAGDRLRVWASLAAPRAPQNPGESNYAQAERAQRRLCRLDVDSTACVQRLRSTEAWGPTIWISRLRARGDALLWQHVAESRVALAAAMLLGVREELDGLRTEEFFKTGTAHLLAISGLNVGFVAYGFAVLTRFSWMSRRSTLGASIVLVVFYAWLTGLQPPVVRATVLVVTMSLARWLGRQSQSANTLSLAGIVVMILNPTSLFDTGSQLSFLAVAALTWLHHWSPAFNAAQDPLDRLIAATRPWPVRLARRLARAIGRLYLASAVVWVLTLPLVVYRFHLVSPVALLVNPIVCFPMAAALFFGFGVFLFGWPVPPLAMVCGRACDANLAAMEHCLAGALRIPAAYWWMPAPPLAWVVGLYGLAAVGLASGARTRSRSLAVGLCSGWVVLTLAPPLLWSPRSGPGGSEHVVCAFAAVGHGTSVLVETPDGHRLLYDAGHQGTPYSAARSISAVLWSRGIWHLDAIVISHADVDHYNAVPQLLDRFRVDRIYVPPRMFTAQGTALRALEAAVRSRGVPVVEVAAGRRLWADRHSAITVLHPPEAGVVGSDNAGSLVLAVGHRGHTVLLPGDLEPPGLQTLLRNQLVDCDVAMAPHHGSRRSDPASFAAWAKPEWVVISGGAWRDTAEVRRAFAEQGARVLHTAESGAVRVICDDRGVRVQGWCDDPW